MHASVLTLINRIHASPVQCVLYLTGGGSQALSDLLRVPGASRTLLEGVVPYCESALADLVGRPPEPAVCAEVARDLAVRALARARRLATTGSPVVGLGATASLATDRPRKGLHHCFVARGEAEWVRVWGLELAKGARTREEEEEVVARLILNALAEACGVGSGLDLGLLPGEHLEAG